MLLTMMSRRPNSLKAVWASEAMRSKSVRSPGTTSGPAPGRLDLLGDGAQLVLGAGGQHDVGPGLGQRHSGGGADAAPAGGDDGDLVGNEESIEDHPANVVGRARARQAAQAGRVLSRRPESRLLSAVDVPISPRDRPSPSGLRGPGRASA